MEKKQKRKVSASMEMKKDMPAIATAGSSDFNPDYSYVVKDLKKIGLMALVFIAFLIVLSFII